MNLPTKLVLITCALSSLGGCVAQQYWVKPETGVQQTSADLYDCRKTGAQAGAIYTGLELEAPCMQSKGYSLHDRPTTLP